ncbi:MAG: uroporphyrinogen-III synthase [Prevotella sp.]|nr:uroporphyrinogen-III synthase [Prevotella sp.]
MNRIIITAPEAYHARWREAFLQGGNNPMEIQPLFMPLITTTPMLHAEGLKALAEHYEAFDYVICSSRRAVEMLAQSGAAALPSVGKIVAIGKDQDAVRTLMHVEPTLTDAEPSMMGIVEALRRLPRLAERRIAVLLPEFEGLPTPSTITRFLEALTSTEAHIETIACYRTSALATKDFPMAIETLRHPQNAAIALTSGGEAHVLARILQMAASQGTPVALPIFSFGPYTTQCAKEAGLSVAATSPTFRSFDDYVRFLLSNA